MEAAMYICFAGEIIVCEDLIFGAERNPNRFQVYVYCIRILCTLTWQAHNNTKRNPNKFQVYVYSICIQCTLTWQAHNNRLVCICGTCAHT
jgi:hypothetical protein